MGCVMLPFVILATPFAVAFAACMFPVAGLFTLATAVIVAFISTQQKLGGFMPIFMVIIPCWIVFHLTIRLEARVEQSPRYRRARYVFRLVTGGLVAHSLALSFTGPFRKGTPFLERLSPTYFVLVLAAVIGIHFLSRKLDEELGGADKFLARLRFRRATA
jgi:hypothetical protein